LKILPFSRISIRTVRNPMGMQKKASKRRADALCRNAFSPGKFFFKILFLGSIFSRYPFYIACFLWSYNIIPCSNIFKNFSQILLCLNGFKLVKKIVINFLLKQYFWVLHFFFVPVITGFYMYCPDNTSRRVAFFSLDPVLDGITSPG
jgi:hypothetical protein